ncbi:MAG: DNA ligase (ATP) [Vezdaea aestivalis]|nr:MAG: DNA ligase (ATP) [Vezdaea aestivalis]
MEQDSNDAVLEKELDAKFPNRPHNRSETLPFHELFLKLFTPLNEIKAKPSGPAGIARRTRGTAQLPPQEKKRITIERFFSRWRKEVGDDIYPALRLILPDRDRDRMMYGLKEKTIAKLLVKTMKIDRNSEDGSSLLNWKVPGNTYAARMAGDFAGRCFEVIKKRPMRTKVGDMTIREVNALLDRLTLANKEEIQLPIMLEFYTRMNPDELLWLIRIILKAMKVGATEKTLLDLWHPDAQALFNVCSSLRQVCWELPNPSIRLHQEDCGVSLMQIFQPQLAQFQMYSIQKIVERLRPTVDDDTFWIEEKLDGERMQLHMVEDDSVAGGYRFGFWSRRAKEYTHLYGSGYQDENSSLTRHLKGVFIDNVSSIVLDGEMITWDPVEKALVPFGTLKTAAISEQRNPYSTTSHRPLFKVFDILLLNGQSISKYTLRDRRRALEQCVRSIPERLEIHSYTYATNATEIETLLRKTVAEGSEGLVLKNPRSMYRLNDRNDDWIKVKPEYMNEFGEDLDCVIIGGYYGSGNRGGRLSSYMCGLRVDKTHIDHGADPMKCLSFFKVGGGFSAQDYGEIRHRTEGKWQTWDRRKPPNKYIELAGGELQYERPDVWIRPDESLVIAVKAAQVTPSDSFRTGYSLRFPRFKSLRLDKDWRGALSVQQFIDLKNNVEKEAQAKSSMTMTAKRKRPRTDKKRPLTIVGTSQNQSQSIPQSKFESQTTSQFSTSSTLFVDLTFHIMTDSSPPRRVTKAKLTALVRAHGGVVSSKPDPPAICIADKKTIDVARVMSRGGTDIIRPSWILDALHLAEIDQGRARFLPPYEDRHLFDATDTAKQEARVTIDRWGDSFCVDLDRDAASGVLDKVRARSSGEVPVQWRKSVFGGADRGGLFWGVVACGVHDGVLSRRLRFGGAKVVDRLIESNEVTHVVAESREMAWQVRTVLRGWTKLPRLVKPEWVESCWEEGQLLAEERFAV